MGEYNNKIYDHYNIRSLSANSSIPSQAEFNKSVVISDLDRASLFNKFFTPSLQLVHAASHQLRLYHPPVTIIDSITLSHLDVLEALYIESLSHQNSVLSPYTLQFTIYFL